MARVTKQMILAAFPPLLTDGMLTPENVEQFLANKLQVSERYIEVAEDDGRYSLVDIFGVSSPTLRYT